MHILFEFRAPSRNVARLGAYIQKSFWAQVRFFDVLQIVVLELCFECSSLFSALGLKCCWIGSLYADNMLFLLGQRNKSREEILPQQTKMTALHKYIYRLQPLLANSSY